MLPARLLLLTCLLPLCPRPAVAGDPAGGRWVDLTHAFSSETIYWPTEPGFQFTRGPNGLTPKGYYYAANRLATAEHGGTHLDAPRHFSAGGQTTEAIPLERLIGEAAIIDASAACQRNTTYEVTIDDLLAWETACQQQLVDRIVLLRTGWADRWPDRKAYLGTNETGPDAIAQLSFPGLSPMAARWLVEHRRVLAIGIDTASIDHGPSTHFGSHVTLCAANIPIFENVGRLSDLPAQGATVIALPMKIAGGSGGPLRIVAQLPSPE